MIETFHCNLVTPERQVLDEEVVYASVPGWDGQVGIAPSRAPLLLKLGDGSLRLDFKAGGSRWFFLAGGFAQMKDNRLSLLTQEAVAAEEIIRDDAKALMASALARVAVSDEDFARRQRDLHRGRTLLELHSLHGAKG